MDNLFLKENKIIKVIFFSFIFLLIIDISQFFNFHNILSDLNSRMAEEKMLLRNIEVQISQLGELNKQKQIELEYSLLDEKGKRIFANLDLKEDILTKGGENLINIIDQWESYIVYLECDFNYNDTKELAFRLNGSGLLVQESNGTILVLTNRHVVSNSDYFANQCTIKLPKEEIILVSEEILISDGGFDWGLIKINTTNPLINEIMEIPPHICLEKPVLGDEIAILGYPSIGDRNNITVTEGIISGFEDEYFITSAKVEQGNSGGAAVLLKNNCYLGTPTFSEKGELESLARILDVGILVD
ncbi:MAG: trypsin-like peptidase domain-containing protein [Candidatus Pacebacteria bacterium]|nr:trypsin-like peptidase domain-containing protein [Candidatus Paceibacterota bacterium]